jgi:hypothetical protein
MKVKEFPSGIKKKKCWRSKGIVAVTLMRKVVCTANVLGCKEKAGSTFEFRRK